MSSVILKITYYVYLHFCRISGKKEKLPQVYSLLGEVLTKVAFNRKGLGQFHSNMIMLGGGKAVFPQSVSTTVSSQLMNHRVDKD